MEIVFIDKKGNKKIKKIEELNKDYQDSIYDTIKRCNSSEILENN